MENDIKHLVTKEDLSLLRADFEKALREQFYRLVTLMIAIQVPTWVGIVGILLKK